MHLDVDPEELDRLVAADVGIAAPLRPALQALEAALRPLAGDAATRLAPWRAQLAEWQEAFPLRYAPSPDVLKPQAVLEALRDRTAGRDDVVFTTGVGQHQMWADAVPRLHRARGSSCPPAAWAPWASACPAAVGARAARPDATVVCVDGDGSFQMTAQELATAVAEDLPVVVVVVNNGFLGMVRQWQDRFHGGRRSASELTQTGPDLAALARAYGCDAAVVESPDELGPAFDAALPPAGRSCWTAAATGSRSAIPMLPPGAAGRDVVEWEGAAVAAV